VSGIRVVTSTCANEKRPKSSLLMSRLAKSSLYFTLSRSLAYQSTKSATPPRYWEKVDPAFWIVICETKFEAPKHFRPEVNDPVKVVVAYLHKHGP